MYRSIAVYKVFGVLDQQMEEEACVWVKLKGGSTISNFKIPRYIVLVEDFPKTSTGKIMKYKIKETMREKLKCMK
ncbi:medium-chain acyl-CoA ligase ACSF2, mitochondrial-like isoform X2 [Tachypleus tridentatus]|uniref:medium-chain acyl-CoA ligase ACSF2, mitochondrial-like isoform X2 n=1 Tax=Tachypleus tridentatus TaxID=6853 RepID=UPI003FD62026